MMGRDRVGSSILAAAVLLAAACGASGDGAKSSPAGIDLEDPPSTEVSGTLHQPSTSGHVDDAGSEKSSEPVDEIEDHQSDLAVGETVSLTGFLVPVDGYRYEDERPTAYDDVLATLESTEDRLGFDLFGAFSLHSVVADDPSDNTAQRWDGKWEVGYLTLIQLNEAPPFGLDAEIAEGSYGAEAIDELQVAGVEVFVFANPKRPNSRFTYSWLDHGVQGFIDGADREPLERWVESYLATPRLAERESGELAARLVEVFGFAYSNVDMPPEGDLVDAFGDAHYSIHAVADEVGWIGNVTLTDSEDPELLGRWLTEMFEIAPVEDVEVGDGRVRHFVGGVDGDELHAFAWIEAEVSGAFTTNPADVDSAKRFLAGFLTSDATPVPFDAAGPSAD